MKTQRRKVDHIKICLTKDVNFKRSNGFENFELIHDALPKVDYEEIDLRTTFLGKKFSAPLFISAMTGGTKIATKINENLAYAAQELGIGMGVGSQEAMIEDKALTETYFIRDLAPNIFLLGNIGASQLSEFSVDQIVGAAKAIRADGLAVHLNPAQEVAQDGDYTNWKNVEENISILCKNGKIPIIGKEVGSGISEDVAKRLESAGVSAIEIAGVGGTNWIRIDSLRTGKEVKDFMEWGIPTAESLMQCVKAVKVPIIASGGVRKGIEIVKSIATASLAGMALPLLEPATRSSGAVKEALNKIIHDIKVAMFLVGAKNLKELREKHVIKVTSQ